MKVVLIDIDTLRPDRMGCYGHSEPTTPNLDRLAGDGVQFTDAYAVDSPCMPSRASLISGRHGACHGAVDFGGESQFLRPTPLEGRTPGKRNMDELTLPNALRKQGIRTATVSTFGNHPAAFFFRGWDHIIVPREPEGPEFPELLDEEERGEHDIFDFKCEGMQTVRGEDVVDEAIAWADGHRDEEFFLHVHLWDPHTPYQAPEEDVELFADTPDLPHPTDEQLSSVYPSRWRDRAEVHRALQNYDAEIHYADRHVGRLLQWFERNGLEEETVFIVTSDHGEAFGEKGLIPEHGSVYQGTAHIPMIVSGPGVASGLCDELAGNIDIAPTVMSLFGGECPAEWQGHDLSMVLKGGRGNTREHLLLSHGVHSRQRALIRGNYKIVRTYESPSPNQERGLELYDLEADPFEQRNIIGESPGVAVELEQIMESEVGGLLRGRPDPLLARHGQPVWLHQTEAQRRTYE
ncbi:MAG: sulfatase [Candidatus Brocadiia bacterium]